MASFHQNNYWSWWLDHPYNQNDLSLFIFFQAEAITVLHDSNLETNSSQSGGLSNNKNLDRLCNKHLENSTTISTTTKSKHIIIIFLKFEIFLLLEFIWFKDLYCLKLKWSLHVLHMYSLYGICNFNISALKIRQPFIIELYMLHDCHFIKRT